MGDSSAQFITGLAIGAILSGGIVWFSMSSDVRAAEAQLHALETSKTAAAAAGTDDRLNYLESIPAGNGTAYLYDSSQGKVWLVSPSGIQAVPPPIAPVETPR